MHQLARRSVLHCPASVPARAFWRNAAQKRAALRASSSLSLPADMREGQTLLLKSANPGAPSCWPVTASNTAESTSSLFGLHQSAVHRLSLHQLQQLYDKSAARGLQQHVLLMVYTNSCGYCRAIEPEFERVACCPASSAGMMVAAVDADEQGVLQFIKEELQVHTVPSILLFPAGSNVFFRYLSAARDAGSLLRFVEVMCSHGPAAGSVHRNMMVNGVKSAGACMVQIVDMQRQKASGARTVAVTVGSNADGAPVVSAELVGLAAAAGLLLAVAHAAVTSQLAAATACLGGWLVQLLLCVSSFGQGQQEALQQLLAEVKGGQETRDVHVTYAAVDGDQQQQPLRQQRPNSNISKDNNSSSLQRLLSPTVLMLVLKWQQLLVMASNFHSALRAVWMTAAATVAALQRAVASAWKQFPPHITQASSISSAIAAVMTGSTDGNGQPQRQYSCSPTSTSAEAAAIATLKQPVPAQAALEAAITAAEAAVTKLETMNISCPAQPLSGPLPGQHLEAFFTGEHVAVSIEEAEALLQLLDAGHVVQELLTVPSPAVDGTLKHQVQPITASQYAGFAADSRERPENINSCEGNCVAVLNPFAPAALEAHDAKIRDEAAAARPAANEAVLESELQQCWDDLLAAPADSSSSRSAEERFRLILQQVVEAGGGQPGSGASGSIFV